MFKFILTLTFFYFQFIIIFSIQYVKVPIIKENRDGSVSIVSKTGKLDTSNIDLEELYFEVIQPQDISYTYRIKLAKGFGSEFKTTFKNTQLIPAEPYDGCSYARNEDKLKGNVALVLRGDCSFTTKAVNIENAGAVAVIITDNDPLNEAMIDMVDDETKRPVNIPAVYLPWKDGYMIKKSLDKSSSKIAIINIPLNLTYKNNKSANRKAPWTQW